MEDVVGIIDKFSDDAAVMAGIHRVGEARRAAQPADIDDRPG